VRIQTSNFNIRTSDFAFRNSRGVALIMVLWVITILSVIVFEFCFAMRTEVNIAKNYKEETQLYALAEAGVQRAIAELIYKNDPGVQLLRRTLKAEEVPPEKREWITDGRVYSLSFDQGIGEVRIMGEAGKVNINTVSESTLRKVIGKLGLEEVKRDTIVDSILDWRDTDDFYRLNGAENDYYQSLKEPYSCKNGPLDSVEELLLIRGVTPALFYGRKEKEEEEGEEGEKVNRIRLKDIFSVYSPGEKVDINSALSPVLRVVLGLPNELAQQVVMAREEKVFQTEPDLLQRVPGLSSLIGEIRGLISYQSTTSYYTIESRAKNKDGKSVQGLKVIVKIDRAEKERYKFIQWVDALF